MSPDELIPLLPLIITGAAAVAVMLLSRSGEIIAP